MKSKKFVDSLLEQNWPKFLLIQIAISLPIFDRFQQMTAQNLVYNQKVIATPKKEWQFWRPHPRDFWYIGSEINEADVSVFVLICQQEVWIT